MPAANPKTDKADAPYRMRDLVRLTGIPRETIHHYLERQILPPAIKTGWNTAVYTEEHLRRLHRIRELQSQFLPLRAIREVLDEEKEPSRDFTPAQQSFLARIRSTMSVKKGALDERVPISELGPEISAQEARELGAAGLIEIQQKKGRETISVEDAQIADCWRRLKATGIDPEHGLLPEHTRIHLESVDRIVRREMELFSGYYTSAAGEEAVAIAERALPVLNDLISRLHTRRFREFMAGSPPAVSTKRR